MAYSGEIQFPRFPERQPGVVCKRMGVSSWYFHDTQTCACYFIDRDLWIERKRRERWVRRHFMAYMIPVMIMTLAEVLLPLVWN